MNRAETLRNRITKWISLLAFMAILVSGVLPSVSHAAGLVICGSETGAEYNDAQQVNTQGGSPASLAQFNKDSCQANQLIPEVVHVINYMIATAALVAVALIVSIGLQMALFASDAGKVKKLKEDLTSVIVGLILIMLAFVFVNTIYNIFQIKINGASGFTFNPFN